MQAHLQGIPTSARAVAGVTMSSIGMFIGMTDVGPMSKPTGCTIDTDFLRAYSDDTSGA
jgi:hypothetical protein